MKTSLIIFPLVILFGITAAVVREHVFLNVKMNWFDAQNYCRKNYRDLSTITSDGENAMVINTAGQNFQNGWIGLYRSATDPNWMWSDEEHNTFLKFGHGEPNGNAQQCVNLRPEGWTDDLCLIPSPFFCERNLVLVKQNMSWGEALEYCRAQYTDLGYLASDTQLDLIKIETINAQTDSVWTGLRFLAGEWFWVSRDPLGSLASLPSCPAEKYRCGAHNVKMNVWENRDCEEKLNFLCN